MVKLTETVLKKVFPKMPADRVAMVVKAIAPAVAKYELNTVNRLAAFIAQTAHESAQFSASAENLNYSADGLGKIFKKYFPTRALCEAYARKPEKIANRVYANRMGNGNEASGDGWRFRGKGWLQVTGHDNVAAFAKALGITLDEAIVYLGTPEGGFMGAGWFWERNKLNALADANAITKMSQVINGGDNGLAERKEYYFAMQKALA